MAETILSTGILLKDPASFNAHVDVGNLNTSGSQKVTVQVFDWGIDQVWNNPAAIQVTPSGTISIGAHSLRSFFAILTLATTQPGKLIHYEVRVTVSDIRNIVVNCFAVDNSGKIVLANTVLHSGLVQLA